VWVRKRLWRGRETRFREKGSVKDKGREKKVESNMMEM
jgi:hypothetical protein